MSSGGNMAQPALAQSVDTKRVHDWLLDYIGDCEKRAAEVSQPEIWTRVDAARRAYNIDKKAIDPQDAGVKAASTKKNFAIRTEDLADQNDEMTALITNLLIQNGPVCRLVAKPGITEQQAELTQNVQESLLKEKDFDAEKRKFAGRFVKYCVAGLKVCRTHEVSYKTERIEVPLVQTMIDPATGGPMMDMAGQPMTVPLYTPEALMQRGFTPEDIEEGGALQSALAEDGYTFVGIADMREDGTFDNLLCTRCSESSQDHVFIQAVDPRMIAVSDITVDTTRQQSIHEYHYLTLTQLQKGYFSNLDKLKEEGESTKDTSQQRPGVKSTYGKTQGTLVHPVYKIVESWGEIPWEQGLQDGRFTVEEARAFAIESGFPVEELDYPTQKWCVFHNCGKVLVKIYPNYLMDKSEYPYDFDSFIFGDGTFAGQGLLERLSNPAANKTAFLNLISRVLKQNLYGSRIYSGSLGLTDGDLEALQEIGGQVRTDTRVDMSTEMHEFTVPDTTPNAMRMVAYFDDTMRGLGVPAVLAGEGSADTATQEAINNRRGQTVVNESFGRMMTVFRNAYRKHLGVLVNSFNQSRYIDIVGENGATMTRRWTMPREITDKLDIVPMISFDDANKQRMSQLFMGIMNIVAPVMGPNSVKELLKLVLRYNRVPETDIAKIEGANGSLTNVHQEVEAMLQDPDLVVEVKMEDPHPICIQMAQMALIKEQARAIQFGYEFIPPLNIQEYIATHEAMLQQQQMMQAMQMMMAGGAPEQGPKGKPKQGRADGGPGSEQGGARQDGQAAGQGNQGPMSAAGLTGAGSIGNVPGVPAGA